MELKQQHGDTEFLMRGACYCRRCLLGLGCARFCQDPILCRFGATRRSYVRNLRSAGYFLSSKILLALLLSNDVRTMNKPD